ncbi:MAG: phosphoribosyltransferase family protein [Rubrivivax sp.]|nr:phosphoribosyltransferase family protein [Rubrivivax sp.]
MTKVFANRIEAGRLLAEHLAARNWPGRCVVLALPRGGVPIGAIVARALGAPLDLLLVRKIGAPGQPELAVAAVVDGTPPQLVVDETLCAALGVDRHYIDARMAEELREIERRRRTYLRGRAPLDITGATAIVVDDGIATGTTVRAALRALRQRNPQRLVLAVPVAPEDTLEALQGEVDDVVCLQTPWPFHAIGQFYRDFHQVGDDEVLAELDSLASAAPAAPQVTARRS